MANLNAKIPTLEGVWINFDAEASGELPENNKLVMKLSINQETGLESITVNKFGVEVCALMNWEYKVYGYVEAVRVIPLTLEEEKQMTKAQIKAYNDNMLPFAGDYCVLNISYAPSAEDIEATATRRTRK